MSSSIIPAHPSLSSYNTVINLRTKLQSIQAQLSSENKKLSSSEIQELDQSRRQHHKCDLGLKNMDKGIKFVDQTIEILTACLQDVEQMSEMMSDIDGSAEAEVVEVAASMTILNAQMQQRLESILDAASNKLTNSDLNISFNSLIFGQVNFKLAKIDINSPQTTFERALGDDYTATDKYNEMLNMIEKMRTSILQACKVLSTSKQSLETDMALLNQRDLATTATITKLTHFSEEELATLADTIKLLTAQIVLATSIVKHLNEFYYQELHRISESLR